MQYTNLEPAEKAAIDLHGFTVFEAETILIEFINTLPKKVKMVEVTHGYSRGTALKKMVKDEFYHWRVKGKRVALNPGITYFVMK